MVFDSVIVDPKVIERITEHERGQMLNYLRITKKRVGLVINFKYARMQWERLVL
jgi:GxxExxY protein